MLSGFTISHLIGECIQISESDPKLQVLAGPGQGTAFLTGCHHVVVAIFLLLPALVASECSGEIARTFQQPVAAVSDSQNQSPLLPGNTNLLNHRES